MSQRDVLAELRTARVEAPAELRARVRLIAADAPQPRRSRRKLALLLVPVVAAAVAAGVFFSTRPQHHAQRELVLHGAAAQTGAVRSAGVPAPTAKRIQRYSASVDLQVENVQKSVTQALRIATSLAGFASSVHIHTSKTQGDAELLLRVPRKHVQATVARISRLGKVTSEQVDIQDLQAGLNTTGRTIARLQRQLKALRAQTQTDATKRQIAALVARVVALQRAQANTIRAAHFATVQVALSTPPVKAESHHHDVRDALPWLGGAAAALVLLLALRGLGRVREDRLLSRP